MDISTIHTKKDYKAAIARIELLIDAESNTPEGDELEILATLVHAYEEINHPIDAPDPIEFIKNVMEFRGYDQKALADLLNSRPRASELLKKLRPLSLKQIRLISGAWDIPVEPLIQEYKLQA